MNAEQAIKRSVSHNEIVTIEHDQTTYDDLCRECEDHVQSTPDGAAEFWGTTESGNEWRVHMRAESRAVS